MPGRPKSDSINIQIRFRGKYENLKDRIREYCSKFGLGMSERGRQLFSADLKFAETFGEPLDLDNEILNKIVEALADPDFREICKKLNCTNLERIRTLIEFDSKIFRQTGLALNALSARGREVVGSSVAHNIPVRPESREDLVNKMNAELKTTYPEKMISMDWIEEVSQGKILPDSIQLLCLGNLLGLDLSDLDKIWRNDIARQAIAENEKAKDKLNNLNFSDSSGETLEIY